jgi:hypothetical protein
MITLGEYLGHLISEVNRARVIADIESVKAARMYAGDELLKYFSVPHMSLPNIELNVPVIVTEVSTEKSYSIKKDDTEKIVSNLGNTVTEHLDKAYNLGSVKIKNVIHESILRYTTEIAGQTYSREELNNSLDKYSIGLLDIIDKSKEFNKESLKENFIAELRASMLEQLITHAILSDEKLKQIAISPETVKIKEMGSSEILLNLKLSISENAMEWVEIKDQKGNISTRLTPA